MELGHILTFWKKLNKLQNGQKWTEFDILDKIVQNGQKLTEVEELDISDKIGQS